MILLALVITACFVYTRLPANVHSCPLRDAHPLGVHTQVIPLLAALRRTSQLAAHFKQMGVSI